MKFSEMPYTRFSLTPFPEDLTALAAQLAAADSAAAQYDLYLDIERRLQAAGTMMALCYARHSINTADEFYEAEQDYYDRHAPLIKDYAFGVRRTLAESRFRTELEHRMGRLMFVNNDLFLRAFSPELLEPLSEENALCTRYEKLLAGALIEFDGKALPLSRLSPYKQSPDRKTRHDVLAAEYGFYSRNRAELDEIFDRLTALRTGMAKTLGFDSYTPLGYLNMQRNCYSPEDVARFREMVRRHVVPLASKLVARQRARIGVPDFKIWDLPFEFPGNNPTPKGTPEDIFGMGRVMYEEMSPVTGEFWRFMAENELFDALAKPNKAPGGYCTDFTDFKSPFIFANFNGTSGDIDVLTHEFGHALNNYLTYGIELPEYRQPTLDACETHSMSMEFLAYPWMHLFFKEDTAKYLFGHLVSALTFLPYGCAVDEFQHLLYERPGLTADERRALWLEVDRKYRPYVDYGDIPFLNEGALWMRQSHIYTSPFYYIDYCLAQLNALQIWALSREDATAALETYMAFSRKGGTKTFLELTLDAGLKSPFEEEAVRTVAAACERYLDGIDDSAF